MHLHLLTITHRDAPLGSIAHAVLPEGEEERLLAHLKVQFDWEELLYLATCNRVTYVFYGHIADTTTLATQVLHHTRPDLATADLEQTAARMRLLSADAAVTHLLELASSMDSLVVGEREILRQLREAYDRCKAWGFTGDHLRLLLRFAIETAKDIYTQTAIGEGALSVVALAFAAMMQNGVRPDARVVMIGAGQTNTLFGKFLLKYGFPDVTIFNRSLARASALAAMGNWEAYTLAQLPEFRKGFDVLVVCTGATEPVVDTREYHQLLAGEYVNKVVIDLALPNNIAPAVVETFPLQYIELEFLRSVAGENFAARERAREHARTIVEARLPVFRERWKERQAERMLSHIPQEIRAVKDRATSEVFAKKIARLDGPAQALLQEMMDYMEKKCISIPMKVVKSMVQETGSEQNMRQK